MLDPKNDETSYTVNRKEARASMDHHVFTMMRQEVMAWGSQIPVKDLALWEGCVTKGLHTLQVLGLPVSTPFQDDVTLNLLKWRYEQSKGDGGGASATAPETWQWVDMLLSYLKALVAQLERNNSEVDDECVLLATLGALAIRALKGSFKATYDWLPWEEAEFLLVSFAAAHSKKQPDVAFVATAGRILSHVRTVLVLVERLERLYRAAGPEVLEGLSKYPKKTRTEYLKDMPQDVFPDCAVLRDWRPLEKARKDTEVLYEDCARLRDWRSLQDIKEALGVAMEVLGPKGPGWEPRGRLALPMALLLVGERVKNTWTSPHLSTHFVNRLQLHLTSGMTKTAQRIRDDLLHSVRGDQRGVYYRRLQNLQHMADNDKKELHDGLQKVIGAVSVLLAESAEAFGKYGLTRGREDHEIVLTELSRIVGDDWRLGAAETRWMELIVRELQTVASTIPDIKVREKFKEVIGKFESDYGLHNCTQDFSTMVNFLGGEIRSNNQLAYRYELFSDLVSAIVTADLPVDDVSSRVRPILFDEELGSVKHYLPNDALPEPTDDEVMSWMNQSLATMRTLEESEGEASLAGEYASRSVLLAIASLWSHRSPTAPCVDFAGPVLYGPLLKNYLAHKDMFIEQCLTPDQELAQLCGLLVDHPERVDLLHGAKSRPRTASAARDEFDRLLSLVRTKCRMFECARQGDVDGLERLQKETYLDLACLDRRGHSLLHAAARGGHAATVGWLLSKMADVLLGSGPGLDVAGSKEAAELLLQKMEHEPYMEELLPCALFRAILDGRVEVARLLLRKGARHPTDVPPLSPAAYSGNEAAVRLVLDEFPPPSQSDCSAALRRAACLGHVGVVRQILNETPQPREAAWGAIKFAARAGHVEVLEALLNECPAGAASADPFSTEFRSANDSGSISLLHLVAFYGHEDAVDFLIEKAPDTILLRWNGHTPLHLAARRGHVGAVRRLLEAIPDTEPLRHGRGEDLSPLGLAAADGHVGVVEELLDRQGWSVDERDRATPIHRAAMHNQKDMVRLLLSRGADRHVTAWRNKSTPLDVAVIGGDVGTVRAMLEPVGVKHSPDEMLTLFRRGDSEESNVLFPILMANNVAIARLVLVKERELRRQGQTHQHTPIVFKSGASTYQCLESVFNFACSGEMLTLLLENMWSYKGDLEASKVILSKIKIGFVLAVMKDSLAVAKTIHKWDRKQRGGRSRPIIFECDGILEFAVLKGRSPAMLRLLLQCMWGSLQASALNADELQGRVAKALRLAVIRDSVSLAECILQWEQQLDPPPKYRKCVLMPLIFQRKDGETPLHCASGDRMQTLLKRFMRDSIFRQRARLSENDVQAMVDEALESSGDQERQTEKQGYSTDGNAKRKD